jgi:hypothetical protein
MKLHDESVALFQSAPIESSIIKEDYVKYHPLGILSDGIPIEFTIPPASSPYFKSTEILSENMVALNKGRWNSDQR